MTRPMPSTEDLLRLAEASLSNAEALIDDAIVLAEAGRFPRAHALATLACEELGKSTLCLRAMWAFSPAWFWKYFSNHEVKLHPAQALPVLESGDPIASQRQYSDRVRGGSRLAHLRKLRGLYVDFSDGTIQTPDDISQPEALAAIDHARTVLEHLKQKWSGRVASAQHMSGFGESGRAVFTLFFSWVFFTRHDVWVSVMRAGDWEPVWDKLLAELVQELKQFNDFDAFVTHLGDQIDDQNS